MVAEHTIEMGELWEEWSGISATIRATRSYAAGLRIDEAGMRAEMLMQERKGKGTPDKPRSLDIVSQAVETAVAWVEEQVLGWNFTGYDGAVLPLGRAGVVSENAPYDLIDQLIGSMSDYYESQRPPVFRASAPSD